MSTDRASAPYHHGRLRADLLDQGRRVLDERGVDGLSLRELARDLGVSSAAPRRHFRDKAALLDALALDSLDELDSIFARLPEVADFRQDLTVLARAYLSFAVEHPARIDLMFARKYNDSPITEALERIMGRVIGVIQRAQQRGEVPAGAPTEIASASFAPVLGLAASVRSGLVTREDMHPVLDRTVDITVHGLRPSS